MHTYSLAQAPPANMDRVRFMTYTATSHQRAFKIFWLPCWELSCHRSLYNAILCFHKRRNSLAFSRLALVFRKFQKLEKKKKSI